MIQYVPSTELKSKLSEYLRLVESGQSFCVTLRGAPIAHIQPIKKSLTRHDAIAYMDAAKTQAPTLSTKQFTAIRHEGLK